MSSTASRIRRPPRIASRNVQKDGRTTVECRVCRHEWMTGRCSASFARECICCGGRMAPHWPRSKWTPKQLKRELVAMLQRAELAPLDLVRAWDKSNDFSFSSKEFLQMMKKIVYSSALIERPARVRSTVDAAEAEGDESDLVRMLARASPEEMAVMEKAVTKLQAVSWTQGARMYQQGTGRQAWYSRPSPVGRASSRSRVGHIHRSSGICALAQRRVEAQRLCRLWRCQTTRRR